MAIHLVRVTLTPLISENFDGEDEDLADGLVRTYAASAEHAEAAEDAALDAFHGVVAINTLEHFGIETMTLLPSAHQRLALIAAGLHLDVEATSVEAIEVLHPAIEALFAAT